LRRPALVLVCLLALLALPRAAAAANHMLVGFQDDPSFRWRDDRHEQLDEAAAAHADILRTTVYWSRVAPTRPASPSSPFDPAYRFDDLDEMIREAGLRDMDVMLTIWGTPGWANGGRGQNYAPTRMSDLQAFARALASRYSGRYAGYPLVRYFTVWNESNLGQFLSPQYDSSGRPVGARIYAQLYRAAYAGIKAGNSRALVGVGETSARGRDHVLGVSGTQETESPGKFAQLLAQQRPALKFDAWSHHPYPTTLRSLPTERVRWPNVSVALLPQFEQSLAQWFHRRTIPIWVTEYGYQTRPEEPRGVSYAQQASYLRTVLTTLRRLPYVSMFVWFVLRDDPTAAWKSGLIERDGAHKPAYAAFAALARVLDGRNVDAAVKGGTRNPRVQLETTSLLAKDGAGANVSVTYGVKRGSSSVATGAAAIPLAADGTVSFTLRGVTVAKGGTYVATVSLEDINGNVLRRTVTLTGT